MLFLEQNIRETQTRLFLPFTHFLGTFPSVDQPAKPLPIKKSRPIILRKFTPFLYSYFPVKNIPRKIPRGCNNIRPSPPPITLSFTCLAVNSTSEGGREEGNIVSCNDGGRRGGREGATMLHCPETRDATRAAASEFPKGEHGDKQTRHARELFLDCLDEISV